MWLCLAVSFYLLKQVLPGPRLLLRLRDAGFEESTLQAVAASSKRDPKQAMAELARHHLIKPVVTQGHIGDVLPDKIVYDA
jgi:hypothetical protein